VVEDAEGIETVAELERRRGFETAQQQVTTYLIDPEWSPLPLLLKKRLDPLDPERDIAFLVRAAAMAPSVYHMSRGYLTLRREIAPQGVTGPRVKGPDTPSTTFGE
jgi:hypothetical protein